MPHDGDNKDKPYDELSELLRKYYKPNKEIESEAFWDQVEKKIDSLFHKEVLSDKKNNDKNEPLSDEERYWFGLEEYMDNKVSSIKYKTITSHLLACKECRQNYNDFLDKKKVLTESVRSC